jgi:hypothetical protein
LVSYTANGSTEDGSADSDVLMVLPLMDSL